MDASYFGNILATLDDGISSIKFVDSKFLGVAGWDKFVRVYDISSSEKCSYSHKGPVLDIAFSSKNQIFSCGADCLVKSYEINTGTETILGKHEQGIRCLEYSTDKSLVISGSWDSTVKFWDPKMKANSCTGTFNQPEKVFAMSLIHEKLVVGTSKRHIHIYDIRSMNEPMQKRESLLKYQTRSIKCYPNGTGFAVSSIEGRISMEYFDPSPEVQKQKYAFKCHRKTENGSDIVYPVNTMAFHQGFGTFASGGCDGNVNFWDGVNRKRLAQIAGYPTSISSLSFTEDGTYLAIASSYTFEEGEKDAPTDSIYVRPVQEIEVKPKTK